MKKLAILAALLVSSAMPAQATVLVLDSGWQTDTVGALNSASNLSPWTFTLAASADFLLTDAFIVGDVYDLRNSSDNSLVATSTFTTDGDATIADYVNASWLDTSFSRLRVTFGPGSYSLNIFGDCAGGCPADLGVQLVSNAVVPEPATWALMIAGFGMVGFAARRRTAATA